MNTIFQRCSVRQFTDEPVSREDLMTLMKAAMAAPTARNAQPWEFLIVQDRNKLDQMLALSPYTTPLKTATAAIVVCANHTRELNVDYDLQDCSAATQNILLQAADMGLGTCWLGMYPNEDRMEKLLTLLDPPEAILPLWVIALGHPAKEMQGKDKFCEDYVHFEKW